MKSNLSSLFDLIYISCCCCCSCKAWMMCIKIINRGINNTKYEVLITSFVRGSTRIPVLLVSKYYLLVSHILLYIVPLVRVRTYLWYEYEEYSSPIKFFGSICENLNLYIIMDGLDRLLW